jgi:hypothetical protein
VVAVKNERIDEWLAKWLKKNPIATQFDFYRMYIPKMLADFATESKRMIVDEALERAVDEACAAGHNPKYWLTPEQRDEVTARIRSLKSKPTPVALNIALREKLKKVLDGLWWSEKCSYAIKRCSLTEDSIEPILDAIHPLIAEALNAAKREARLEEAKLSQHSPYCDKTPDSCFRCGREVELRQP